MMISTVGKHSDLTKYSTQNQGNNRCMMRQHFRSLKQQLRAIMVNLFSALKFHRNNFCLWSDRLWKNSYNDGIIR